MNASGYSGTPLAKKLGIKEGFKVRLINHPPYYFECFTDLPAHVEFLTDTTIKKDLIHYFATSAADIQKHIQSLKTEIKETGTLWISWHKKAARMPTDITEDVIRKIALSNGLIDVKVCAVDAIWSGLKLVIPVNDRSTHR